MEQLKFFYLKIFKDVDRKDPIDKIKEFLKQNYEHNTLGARMIATLINQYFIKGGTLGIEDVEEVTFQETLKLED